MVVRAVRDSQELQAALELRERVFCGEQGVSGAGERDGRDHEALHVVALEADSSAGAPRRAGGRLLGTCRLLFDGDAARLGRMAVEPDSRGRGVGTQVLLAAEELARARGASRMTLHAQIEATGVYERAGYEPRGERFMEEGIEHVTMEKPLA
jgi:predicted GNAT family N-acyltransferase